MRHPIVFALLALALAFALPASANAGTVTRTASAITFTSEAATGASEDVTLGIEAGKAVVASARGVTSATCTQTDANRVDCDPAPLFVVNLLGFDDRVSAEAVTGTAALELHGGGGNDNVDGTPNADKLFGDDGGDLLDGRGGNDQLDGGLGDDNFYDGPGDDSASGGPGGDTFTAGPGHDTMSGGDGGDTVDYHERGAPVTITLDGQPDDGEAGEGDNVGADIEDVRGGAGNDRIIAGPLGTRLHGSGGNDAIKGGPLEDRLEGEEGDDTIDARDGAYDSIDCGTGNDTVLADPGDSTTGCEIAPDRDGDGFLNEADCAPDNPAVNPNAAEIFGNPIDEDCKGGPSYFQVDANITYKIATRKRPARVRFTSIRLSSLRSGDRVEVRCKGGKAKGCPFTVKKQTARKSALSIVSVFKRRFLRSGAVVEIRILRANYIAKVLRLTIGKKADVKLARRCLPLGGTKVGVCPKTP